MSVNKPKSWEEVRDTIASAESFDDEFGASYDRIVYDLPNKGNAAGIKPPKPISQMTIGELNDWQEKQMRPKSRDYGTKKYGPEDPRAKYGSTGVGRYQFERNTLIDTAKSLYGNEYNNVVFTSDVQEKLARHLYDQRAAQGPESLGNTWNVLRTQNASTSLDDTDKPPLSGGGASASVTRGAGANDPIDRFKKIMGIKEQNQSKKSPTKITSTLAENTITFKDLRHKIYEQIILNEQKEQE